MVRLSAPNTPRGARRCWPACGETSVTRYRHANTVTASRSSRHPPEAPRSREAAMWRPGRIRRVKASQFRGRRLDQMRGRTTAVRIAIQGVLASLLTALPVASSTTTAAQAASSCPANGCTVTVDAHDFASGNALANFTFIVNDDNSKLPGDPLALNSESYTPIVAEGDQDQTTVNLPAGRYLITVR